MSKSKKNYRRKKQFKNYKRAKIRKTKEIKNPDITFRVEFISLDDPKSRKVIDSYSYESWLKDYFDCEGGDDNE